MTHVGIVKRQRQGQQRRRRWGRRRWRCSAVVRLSRRGIVLGDVPAAGMFAAEAAGGGDADADADADAGAAAVAASAGVDADGTVEWGASMALDVLL